MSSDLTITLVNTASGESESLPLPASMLVQDAIDLVTGIFGINSKRVALFKDGKVLARNLSLQAAGVQNGDLIAAQEQQQQRPPAPAPAAAAATGGLDFSSLLSGAAAPASSSVAAAAAGGGGSKPTGPPVYYPGMGLDDAIQHNPHPYNFISLLQQHDHLFKELRYHQPQMAQKLQNQSLERAVTIWREELVKGSIAGALKSTGIARKRLEMQNRLSQNPNDPVSKEYFSEIDRKQQVEQQYYQMMEQYPESLGRVLMLYVEAKINAHPIQAFCDSGAQMTIMSKKVATMCGLAGLIDTRFAGVAAGVGTGKILGRIHIVQLQIGNSYYPCSVSVMDDPAPGATEMPFLLGLDMMKRHLCQIDLRKGVLRFTVGNEEIPFLHEKDLNQSQGGTMGFDAEKANEELRILQES
eukprot:CAMPEP_0198139362 /NCGR_PEP_ID=MMETSP1443-20131203/2683_1 /TAXON_ID=186043 /ORGANISM="Entomoneis sp., Strain CCMP2396" /LENGTH=411 /DNA_ID=CAMNT_0043801471 /DNA_START=158 /DNA_END=1390 /DNA_ORIENTATION=-